MQDNTIKLQVEMLPIQNHDGYCHKSELTLFDKKIKIQEHSSHAGQNNPMRHAASILQHLYFISNNEIKRSGKIPTKGTWCYRWYDKSINNHVGVIEKYREGLDRESIFLNEIVASTDPAIGLPTIPTTWIRDVYVPSNGSIKEVKLEKVENIMEDVLSVVGKGIRNPPVQSEYRLKLTPNNEVCIVGDRPIERNEDNIPKEFILSQYDAKEWVDSIKPEHQETHNKKCSHTYSKAMNQQYPRLCIKCGTPEFEVTKMTWDEIRDSIMLPNNISYLDLHHIIEILKDDFNPPVKKLRL